MSTLHPKPLPTKPLPKSTKIAIATARFNPEITDQLLAGCLRRLHQLGLADNQITTVRVPGAFELPVTARAFADSQKYSAIICLGAVVRGETPHFDYVAGECARGLQAVATTAALPVIFGVLTTNTQDQARDRIGGKHGHTGEHAANTAIEMIAVLQSIRRPKRTTKR
jgi:6,7-dimethyl-8-ribityllumazine synthase